MSINRSDILWKINGAGAFGSALGASFLRRTYVTIRTSELGLRLARLNCLFTSALSSQGGKLGRSSSDIRVSRYQKNLISSPFALVRNNRLLYRIRYLFIVFLTILFRLYRFFDILFNFLHDSEHLYSR